MTDYIVLAMIMIIYFNVSFISRSILLCSVSELLLIIIVKKVFSLSPIP